MKTDTAAYMVPTKLKTLVANSYETVPEFSPEFTILDFGSGKSLRYSRPYRWCYRDRCSLDETVTSVNARKTVNELTLCKKRTALVKKVVGRWLIGAKNTPHHSRVDAIFEWIDRQNRAEDLYNLEASKALYKNYTGELRHRLSLSTVGEVKARAIKNAMANSLQRAMAFLCSLSHEESEATVKSWAFKIPQGAGGFRASSVPATTSDAHELAVALHTRFFDAFSSAVINKTTPPVVVKLHDLGFDDLVYYSQQINSTGGFSRGKKKGLRAEWMPYFYRCDGVFEGKPKEFNALLKTYDIAPLNIKERKHYNLIQESAGKWSSSSLRELANHATRHFGYLLMAESGANSAHLAWINYTPARLGKDAGPKRVLAVKPRAGYERQLLTIDVNFFKTTWARYFKLRAVMAKGIDAPEEGLFLLGRRSDRPPHVFVNSSNIKELSQWPDGAPSLATRTGRRHKIVNVMEGSGGNVALAADMMSATTQTIESHYAFKNQKEAAKEMAEYFEAQGVSAKLRNNGVQVISVIDEGDQTTVARCSAKIGEEPRHLDGLDGNAPKPNCRAPLTCMFCAHFGLHAEEKDLIRLLSIRQWIEFQTKVISRNLDEHMQKFLPFVERIDEIMTEFRRLSEPHAIIVESAEARVNRGDLDLYWKAKINAFHSALEV